MSCSKCSIVKLWSGYWHRRETENILSPSVENLIFPWAFSFVCIYAASLMWHRGTNVPAQDLTEWKVDASRIVCLSLCSFKVHIHGLLYTWNTALRISRYCYIVNIASHLPPLIPPGCVFIHHTVMSNLQEWMGLAGFCPSPWASPWARFSPVFRTYLFSHAALICLRSLPVNNRLTSQRRRYPRAA